LFVACKVPNGLNISGAGKQITLLGPGNLQPQDKFGGYAITPNVPNDLWEAWSKANADSALIENKIVFAEENLQTLQARAWSRARVGNPFQPAFK
jgi:hypothetical protein